MKSFFAEALQFYSTQLQHHAQRKLTCILFKRCTSCDSQLYCDALISDASEDATKPWFSVHMLTETDILPISFIAGGLVVSAGVTLTVNTSALVATDSNGNSYNLTFRNYSYGDADGTWNYTVAHLSFVGNVSFESGSTVNLTGSNALAIISQNGGIVVNTTVNLTNPVNDSSPVFLGGYGVDTQPRQNYRGGNMYQGMTHNIPLPFDL